MANIPLSLRARIFISMLFLIIITFVVTGLVLSYHFQREEEEYHKERLQRKEYAIRASIDYFLTPYKMGITEKEIPEMFTDKICEISDIHNLDIAIYSVSGYLLISSNEEAVAQNIIPLKIEPTLLYRVLNRDTKLTTNYKGETEYLSSFSVIYNDKNRPVAIVNLPYYIETNRIPPQDVRFIRTLASIYALLFIGAVVLAFLLSNYITGTLRTIGENLKDVRLNRRNKKIAWQSSDEIGELITEYNHMVDELEQSAIRLARSERESAWKEMARQVAHEIKNPLTPMRLLAQHLDGSLKTSEPEKLHEHTAAMIDQIDAMSSIAESFSRFAEMPEYKREPVDVNELISRSVAIYTNLNIKTNVPAETVYAMLDRELMIRVFNNLIKNAAQAIPEGREPALEIGVKRSGTTLKIWVADNGSGIAEAQQERIFEPSFTTKSQGMGMGLAIVKTIVIGLGGKIWFDTKENIGTTFYIEFNTINT
jgi:signal transduction histidine kinase